MRIVKFKCPKCNNIIVSYYAKDIILHCPHCHHALNKNDIVGGWG